jgi:hypothetical protein
MERSDLNAFSFVRDRLFFLPRWQLLAASCWCFEDFGLGLYLT